MQRADYTVYLYNADNAPVVAPDASITEGGVYTDTGFVGTLDTANRIVDGSGVVVGYVVYQVPAGP